MAERDLFTSAELARITRATTAQISRLERAGVLKPATRGSRGRGNKHLFDARGVQATALAIYLGDHTRMPAKETARIVAYLNRRQWETREVALTVKYDGQGRLRVERMGTWNAPVKAVIEVGDITRKALRRMSLLMLARTARRRP